MTKVSLLTTSARWDICWVTRVDDNWVHIRWQEPVTDRRGRVGYRIKGESVALKVIVSMKELL